MKHLAAASKARTDQNDRISTRKETNDGTAGEIAVELNAGPNAPRRAEHFAKGEDALREISHEAADKVPSGEANVTGGEEEDTLAAF